MTGFSVWHWIIVLLLLLSLVAVPLAFVARAAPVAAFARRFVPANRPLEQRLAELDALHVRGAISARACQPNSDALQKAAENPSRTCHTTRLEPSAQPG